MTTFKKLMVLCVRHQEDSVQPDLSVRTAGDPRAHLLVDDIIDGEDAVQQALHKLQVLSRGLRGGVPSRQTLCQHDCHRRGEVRHAHVWLRQQACERLLHLCIVPARREKVIALQLALFMVFTEWPSFSG